MTRDDRIKRRLAALPKHKMLHMGIRTGRPYDAGSLRPWTNGTSRRTITAHRGPVQHSCRRSVIGHICIFAMLDAIREGKTALECADLFSRDYADTFAMYQVAKFAMTQLWIIQGYRRKVELREVA